MGKDRSWRVITLAISFLGDAPPTEFRIFAAGENATTKGTFLFDAEAAAQVMAAYQRHGTDVMLDLEHLSLESPVESRNFDPDARGWCRLELHNGELWAVGVKWTPDGMARLTDKRQRYVSPAFEFDTKTRRITSLLNIAITALPATDNLTPLVAANAVEPAYVEGEKPIMSPEQFAQIAEALGLGADANVEDVLATVAAMVKKIQDAANGEPAKEEPKNEAPAEAVAAAEAAPPVVAATKISTAAHALARLSGKKDIGQIVEEVTAWRASHVALEAEREKLAKEHAVLESGERRRLTGELVKLGSETPATAWADDAGTKPAEPWSSMPIDLLRERVAKLSKAKGVTPSPAPKPAVTQTAGGDRAVIVRGETVMLSASEVAACTEANAKIEDYAANKLIRLRAQKKRTG